MRDNVFWRKQSTIVMMLAKELGITPERALDLFYSTDVCRQLSDAKTGLCLMSDGYVLEDVLNEIRKGERVYCPRERKKGTQV